MPERRYNEHEIASIFEQAAHAQEAAQKQVAGGLTLAELQEIGASAGIDPAFIRRAAAVVDHTPKMLDAPTMLGIPVGVGRTVDLPGPMTDDDWARLVADLRMTFNAKGKRVEEGGYRQWSNGNLKVTVEPVAQGHRVRLRTRNGNLQSRLMGGGLALAVAVVMFTLVLFGLNGTFGEPGGVSTWVIPAIFAAWALGSTYVELPAWRRTRAQQMEAVAARLVEHHVPPVEAALDAAAPRLGTRLDLDALLGEETEPEVPTAARGRRRGRS